VLVRVSVRVVPPTEDNFKELSERFESLAVALQTAQTDKQRRQVLKQMRALIAAADTIVLREGLHDSESARHPGPIDVSGDRKRL
jgi:hypothetical protein